MKRSALGISALLSLLFFSCQVQEIERTGEPQPGREQSLDSEEQEDENDGEVDTEVLEAFEGGLFLTLEDASCSCHDNINPKFLKDDAAQSYDTIATLIDLDDPTSSPLYTKIEEKEHNCGSTCSDVAEDLLTGIEDMAAAAP